MSLASFIRRSAFVAVALSLTASGLTTVPAAAKPQPFPGPGQPQLPPKPVFNPNPPKPVFIPVKPIVLPNPPKPVVNPPQPGPIVKPIDICVIMPSKCVKPVVVNPPPVIVTPAPIMVEEHVIARPEPVYVPRPVAVEAPAATCNCLTKQYQTDGSVIFRDVCTHEAAMATPDDLKAQAQAAAQQQTQPAQVR